MSAKTETLEYHYRFTFPDGEVKDFCVSLDAGSLRILDKEKESYPDWTKLSCFQCPNCPLSEDKDPRCPVAVSLVEVIEFSKDRLSIEDVNLEVYTEARSYMRKTPLAKGSSTVRGGSP